MAPNKDTVGALGEILVDNNTGYKYKCAYICKTTNDKGVYYTYEWERIYDEESGSSSPDSCIICDTHYEDTDLPDVTINLEGGNE